MILAHSAPGEVFRAIDPDGVGISIGHRAQAAEGESTCPGCGDDHATPGLTSVALMHPAALHPTIIVLTDDEAAQMLSALGRVVFGVEPAEPTS